MIALIKYSGELVTFNMATKKAEEKYAKDFLNVPENCRLHLGKLGRIFKEDIVNLKRVRDDKEAKDFHKGTLNVLKKVIENEK